MREFKKHQFLPADWNKREILRNKGQFWTPSWVANAMMAYVIKNTVKVFDPATGKGAFLQAFFYLAKDYQKFYGIDIDPEVLKDDIYFDQRCSVEIRDYLKNPPPGKFSAIIANPPYIRHHRIDPETKVFLKSLCKKITGFTLDGRSGYHIYFLLNALDHLEENGRLAFIMPSDTCEGKFAVKLWNWIATHFRIECVITFEEQATPFPSVDTNALIFFIKKTPPVQSLNWIISKEPYNDDLLLFVSHNFSSYQNFASLEIHERTLAEALKTGLSRKPDNKVYPYKLSDFAKVMRGIATGSNDFFFLNENQIREHDIPSEFLKFAIGRTKDLDKNIIDKDTINYLNKLNRPVYLFSPDNRNLNEFPDSVRKYLKLGEEMGLPQKSLISQRNPWYKMEKRIPPPILFTYLGRRNVRFIRNLYNVLPLTCFLCVYPLNDNFEFIDNLYMMLNEPEVIDNLRLVAKSYGSGALKVEPRQLQNLPIPEKLIEKYDLLPFRQKKYEQILLFQ